jgi:hypothetical protein
VTVKHASTRQTVYNAYKELQLLSASTTLVVQHAQVYAQGDDHCCSKYSSLNPILACDSKLCTCNAYDSEVQVVEHTCFMPSMHSILAAMFCSVSPCMQHERGCISLSLSIYIYSIYMYASDVAHVLRMHTRRYKLCLNDMCVSDVYRLMTSMFVYPYFQ